MTKSPPSTNQQTTPESFNWKVAGFAGEGVMSTGLIFSKVAARHGLYIFDYTEYPSLIKGGHNTYQVHASTQPVTAQKQNLDLLIALNKNAIDNHKNELTKNSLVLYDKADDKIDITTANIPCEAIDLPMVALAKETGGSRLMGNNVGLGASVYLLGLEIETLDEIIQQIFGRKGKEVVELNQKAAQAGFDFVKAKHKPLVSLPRQKPDKNLTLTGNEAIGLGALAGGLQFYAAYPMTPSSSILHFLAKKAPQTNIVVKHAEDEISVVNMAIGAAFTGIRAMVGTSGGGFCYMTEALGLSGIAEIPLVVIESMRPGPALGMPTWTAQGDILFIINASQDEFPRFVFTPGDAQEAFELTRKSLDLAEKYQTLAIVVSDKYLSESRHTMELETTTFTNKRHGFAHNPKHNKTGFFPRYKPTENGISPRTTPGTLNGTHIANSYEHDEYGLATEESEMRIAQMNKRQKKFKLMQEEIPTQLYNQQPGAQLTFISFGSTKGPLTAARKILTREKTPTNHLHLSWLWPFPTDQVTKVIEQSHKVVVIEGNSQGQLAKLIAQETGHKLTNHLRRYDGRPFFSEDIVEYVTN